MASGFQEFIGMGNLVRDPERRKVGDSVVASFSVAINTKRGGKEQVIYVECNAWNKTADFVSQWFGKGKPIIVVGEFQNREWTGKDGQKRSRWELTVSKAHFGGTRKDDDQAGDAADNVPPDITEDEARGSGIPF